MIVLGLDCATKTGWAIFRDGVLVESGVQDFTKQRGETNGLLFLRFRNWLNALVAQAGQGVKPEGILIAYERAHFRGGAATEIGVGLQTRVQETAASEGIEAAPVHTGTLKKWATGNGAAGKATMIEAAKLYMRREPLDDNEADAVLVAAWAASVYDMEVVPMHEGHAPAQANDATMGRM